MKPVILALLLFVPAPAAATLVWDWTGVCESIGSGHASPLCTHATVHVVTTDAYVPGDPTGGPLFSLLEWTYADDVVGPVDLATYYYLGHGSGFSLPATPDGGGGITLVSKFFFASEQLWQFGSEGLAPNCGPDTLHSGNCGYFAEGRHGHWTRVPAPASLALLGLGLLLLYMHAQRVARARRRLHDHVILARFH